MRSVIWLQRRALFLILVAASLVNGCTGVHTFSPTARSGDTVTLALGWHQELMRHDISRVMITAADGNVVTYLAGSPKIRSLFHSYPDPVSRLIVDAETGSGSAMSTLIEGTVTSGDKEYSQAMMLLDTPQGMAVGTAEISISLVSGEDFPPVSLEIIPGIGASATFENREGLAIGELHLSRLERAAHHTITFSGPVVPYGIEVNFSHDPDSANGGNGEAYVANPRGDVKNVSWSDDGYNLKVMLLPARDRVLTEFVQYKFYIAGGLTGLLPGEVKAFDHDGVAIPDVAVHIQ